ncbi:hypothetical protein D9M69_437180 [compost metagenome]
MKFLFDDEDEAPAKAGNGRSAMPRHKQAISHWGEAQGCILETSLADVTTGEPLSVIKGGEDFAVRIRCRLPDNVEASAISVAWSIKNLSGSDLIVATTWDSGFRFESEMEGEVLAEFKLNNHLAPGNYMLAVALEDKSGATVRYLEYIEGSLYFSSMWPGTVHGMFVPHMKQAISINSQIVATCDGL